MDEMHVWKEINDLSYRFNISYKKGTFSIGLVIQNEETVGRGSIISPFSVENHGKIALSGVYLDRVGRGF